MRLIDEEALMEDIQKTITEQSGTIDWLNLINSQPTAFDVDKVVEKLEYESDGYFMLSEMYDKGTVSLKTAVEIVRAGGKN